MIEDSINLKLKLKKPHLKIKSGTYKTHKDFAIFVDDLYGEFVGKVSKVLYNTKEHPERTKNKKRTNKRWTLEEFIKFLKNNAPFITFKTLPDNFKMYTRYTFIDEKFGEYEVIPETIYYGHVHKERCKEKRKQTMLKKYGVEYYSKHKDFKSKITNTYMKTLGVSHNMHNLESLMKVAKSSNNKSIKYNWKDNSEVVCIGSYESKTVDYLNKNKIEYKWQPDIFYMENGSSYRPDLYLEKDNIYVEIKGYFRKDALEKWNWFSSKYKNSELWNEKKLKEMKIL